MAKGVAHTMLIAPGAAQTTSSSSFYMQLKCCWIQHNLRYHLCVNPGCWAGAIVVPGPTDPSRDTTLEAMDPLCQPVYGFLWLEKKAYLERETGPHEISVVPGFFFLLNINPEISLHVCLLLLFWLPTDIHFPQFYFKFNRSCFLCCYLFPDKNRSKSTSWENGLQYFTSSVTASLPCLFISVFLQHFHSFSFSVLFSFMSYPGKNK